MIERQKGDIIFICDSCEDSFATETSDFGSARVLLRREGWKTKKFGDDWCHFCETCKVPDAKP